MHFLLTSSRGPPHTQLSDGGGGGGGCGASTKSHFPCHLTEGDGEGTTSLTSHEPSFTFYIWGRYLVYETIY